MYLDQSISKTQTTGIILSSPQLNGSNKTFGSLSGGVLRFKSGTFVEDIYYATATIGSDNRVTLATGVVRNVNPNNTTAIVSLGAGYGFSKGALVELTQDCRLFNLSVKTDTVQTITGKKTFSVPFAGATIAVAANLAATYPSAVNGDQGIYATDTGLVYDFIGGVWTARGANGVAAATTTTQGKVQLATRTDAKNQTANPNVLSSNITAETSASTGIAEGSVVILNSASKVDGSLGGLGSSTPALGLIPVGAGSGSAMTFIGPGSNGQVPVSNGTTIAMGAVPLDPLVKNISSAVGSIIGASSTAEADVTAGYTLPANDITKIGDCYVVEAMGKMAVDGTTCTLRLKIAGNTVATGTLSSGGTTGGGTFHLRAFITVTVIGASGFVTVSTLFDGKASTEVIQRDATLGQAIDTTTTNIIKLTTQYTGNSANNGTTMYQFLVYKFS